MDTFFALLVLSLSCMASSMPFSGDAVTPFSGDAAECRVPPYSLNLHEVNLTAENEALLLTEGECYLGCLSDSFDYAVTKTTASYLDVYSLSYEVATTA